MTAIPPTSSPMRIDVPRRGVASVTAHLLLAGLSGLMLALAFPEPGWWPLAHVALVPAVVPALRSTSTRRLLWTTYLVSLAWWLLRLSWITGVTFGGYLALSAYMALYFPATLLLVRVIARNLRGIVTLSLPMAWVSLEWLRGLVLAGGFGWFALGHTQAAYEVGQHPGLIAQSAALFGEWTVSFLVAMTNGLIVDLLVRSLRKRKHDGTSRWSKTALTAIGVWCVAYAAAIVSGVLSIAAADSPSVGRRDTVRVAVIQTNIPQNNKIEPTWEAHKVLWRQLDELTRAAAAEEPDLIVWPETMTPASIDRTSAQRLQQIADAYAAATPADLERIYKPDELLHQIEHHGVPKEKLAEHFAQWYAWMAQTRQRVADLARDVGVPILVGSGTDSPPDAPDSRFNSAYLVHADGSYDPNRYDKTHRVPFGEFIPWVDSSPALKDLFIKYLSPYAFDYTIQQGRTYTVFTLPASTSGGTRGDESIPGANPRAIAFAVPICFEDAIARATRRLVYTPDATKRVDFLVNITNDGWYPDTHQNPQHVQIAAMRCIENRIAMARAVNTGISGFIDPVGRVGPLVVVNGQTQAVAGYAVHDLPIAEAETLFGRVGQVPVAVLTAVTAILAVVAVFRGKVVRK